MKKIVALLGLAGTALGSNDLLCETLLDVESCLSQASGIAECTWCGSTTSTNGQERCYSIKDKQLMELNELKYEFPTLTCYDSLAEIQREADKKCHEYLSRDSCASNKGGEHRCLWCQSAAVPSACYNSSDALKLPPGVFECHKKQNREAVFNPFVSNLMSGEHVSTEESHRCHFFNNENSCLNSKEKKPCLWCTSAAVPSMCYDEDEASQLPPGVFECKHLHTDTDPVNHECHFYNKKESCLKIKEGGKPCYWCSSSAVPSVCYNESEATALPPAVFECVKDLDELNLYVFHRDFWELYQIPSLEKLGQLYHIWKQLHGKEYQNSIENNFRRLNFEENTKLIVKHNVQPNKTYVLELNQFADMNWDEFQKYYLGANGQNCSATTSKVFYSNDIPESRDWREIDAVSPVKNQGHCGSCWTFSTTGCLESHYKLKFGEMRLFSEQNLVDCAQAFDNHGCNGGLPSHAFEYVKYNGGLDTEETYPYHGKDEICKFRTQDVGVKVVDIVNVTSRNELELVSAVGTVGPVSIAYQVANDFRFYKGGVYDSKVCKSGEKDVNHAVLAVGYDTTSRGEKYWIVKNSWSANWGIDGYFHIARGKNMCGLADCASYPVL